jgi:hypothetical protein
VGEAYAYVGRRPQRPQRQVGLREAENKGGEAAIGDIQRVVTKRWGKVL